MGITGMFCVCEPLVSGRECQKNKSFALWTKSRMALKPAPKLSATYLSWWFKMELSHSDN